MNLSYQLSLRSFSSTVLFLISYSSDRLHCHITSGRRNSGSWVVIILVEWTTTESQNCEEWRALPRVYYIHALQAIEPMPSRSSLGFEDWRTSPTNVIPHGIPWDEKWMGSIKKSYRNGTYSRRQSVSGHILSANWGSVLPCENLLQGNQNRIVFYLILDRISRLECIFRTIFIRNNWFLSTQHSFHLRL